MGRMIAATKKNGALIAIGAIVVAAGLAALFFFLHRSDQAGPSGDPAAEETYRRDYIVSAIASCADSAAKNPKVAEAHYSSEMIKAYCQCFAEKSVDQLSAADMGKITANHSLPPELLPVIEEDAKACGALHLKEQP
jgi:hypothetical protein